MLKELTLEAEALVILFTKYGWNVSSTFSFDFIGFVFSKIFVVCLVFSIGFDEATIFFQFLFGLDTLFKIIDIPILR